MLEPLCWSHCASRMAIPIVSPKCPFLSIPTLNLWRFWQFWCSFMAQNRGADNFKQRKAVRQSGRFYVMTKKCQWFQTCRGLLEDYIWEFLSLPPVWRCQFGPQQKRIFASFPLRGRAENLRNEDKLAQCQDIPTSLWAGSSKMPWLVPASWKSFREASNVRL